MVLFFKKNEKPVKPHTQKIGPQKTRQVTTKKVCATQKSSNPNNLRERIYFRLHQGCGLANNSPTHRLTNSQLKKQTHQFTTSLPPILWGKMVHRRAAEITENAQSNLWHDVEESKKSLAINNPHEWISCQLH